MIVKITEMVQCSVCGKLQEENEVWTCYVCGKSQCDDCPPCCTDDVEEMQDPSEALAA